MQLSLKIAVIILMLALLICAGSVMLYTYGPEEWQGTEILYNLHKISGQIFILAIFWHLYLNRKWLINNFKRGKK